MYYFTRFERGNEVAAVLIGILDIVVGAIVYFSRNFTFTSNNIIIILCFFYFCLGFWSLATNIFRKNYFDWRGIVDLMSAFCLISIFLGNIYGIFTILGILIIIKGLLGIILLTTKE